MDVKVVDTSALAALLFGEPEAEIVAAQLAGARLVEPALLAIELANVCLIKSRRQPDRLPALIEAFRLWVTLGVEVAVDHAEVVALATATGLTAYDADYLWLSRRLGAELVTLDKKLARTAAAVR